MKSTIWRMLESAAAFVRPVLIAQALMVLLAVAVFSSSASARPSVYVVGVETERSAVWHCRSSER